MKMEFNPFDDPSDDTSLSDVLNQVRLFTEMWVRKLIQETAGPKQGLDVEVDVDISLFNVDVKKEHLSPKNLEFQEYSYQPDEGYVSYYIKPDDPKHYKEFEDNLNRGSVNIHGVPSNIINDNTPSLALLDLEEI